jgi:hypothetical protein
MYSDGSALQQLSKDEYLTLMASGPERKAGAAAN